MFFAPGTPAAARIATVIPSGRETPRPTRHAGKTYTWLQYEQAGHTQPSIRQPDPAVEPELVYRFNSLGYRCPEFSQRAALNVVSVGCSETFGIGLRERDRFSAVFCGGLAERTGRPVQDFNLGAGGKSNDWIARTVLENLAQLRPDYLLVCYTYPQRREYIDITGRWIDFLPGVPLWEIPPEMKDAWNHLLQLASPSEDLLNFCRNHLLVAAAARRLGVRLLCTYLDEEVEPALTVVEPEHSCGQFYRLDTGTDGVHRYVRSNRAIAMTFLERV